MSTSSQYIAEPAGQVRYVGAGAGSSRFGVSGDHGFVDAPVRRPGQGMLDRDAFFEVVAHLGEDTAVIVEHLPPEQALEAIAYVKQAGEQRGFTFS